LPTPIGVTTDQVLPFVVNSEYSSPAATEIEVLGQLMEEI
jgi:hypothetical protein